MFHIHHIMSNALHYLFNSFHVTCPTYIETSPLLCKNQWIGFYIKGTLFMFTEGMKRDQSHEMG